MYNNINPGQVAIGDVAGKGQASNSTPDRKPPQFLTSSWATTKDVVAAAGKSARETFEDIKFDPAGVFGETKNDVVDIYRKAQGDTGLCTRCESFPSMDIRAAAAESITWHTPLSRLLYHADWCQLCSFLLTMLCRPENDPLKHAEVAAHLPSSLRGMSMKEWTAKGWKYAEDNWPFGKGEFRAEGATYRFGHASDQAQALFKQALFKQSLRNAKTIRNASPSKKAAAERTKAEVWAAAAASSVMNSDNVQQRLLDEGRRSMTRHQKPCNLVLNIITNKNSNGAGMVFASLCGFGNRPQGDMHTLSCFRLRVTYPGLQGVPGPRTALWYGNVLHKQWIDLSIGRYWIKECLERHDENCSRPGWSAALENLDFLRVIDVDKMCLYETKRPGSCRFVALSYKWGDVAACTLRADNIHALSRPGGLSAVMDTLPQTIIDAIEVVRTLGERFLWVDSFVCWPLMIMSPDANPCSAYNKMQAMKKLARSPRWIACTAQHF
jgi:hypothetical protein